MVPLAIFPDSPPLVEGKILYKPCDFVDLFFFARVLVEVQFLGYKFGLKGSTYTRENMISINKTKKNEHCPYFTYICMYQVFTIEIFLAGGIEGGSYLRLGTYSINCFGHKRVLMQGWALIFY